MIEKHHTPRHSTFLHRTKNMSYSLENKEILIWDISLFCRYMYNLNLSRKKAFALTKLVERNIIQTERCCFCIQNTQGRLFLFSLVAINLERQQHPKNTYVHNILHSLFTFSFFYQEHGIFTVNFHNLFSPSLLPLLEKPRLVVDDDVDCDTLALLVIFLLFFPFSPTFIDIIIKPNIITIRSPFIFRLWKEKYPCFST